MKEGLDALVHELDIPKEEILKAYKSYWMFIRNKIESLPLKEDLSEEEFSRLRTNFNIPKLGKLHCNYERYKVIKRINNKRIQNAEYKESKTDGQLCAHHKGCV